MALVYLTCASGTPVAHVCDPCNDTEKGGIRSLILIKDGSTLGGALTIASTLAEWTAAIEAGDVVIIPETSGSFDGGTAKMGKGFGDLKERLIGYDNVLQVKDPNYSANVSFWEWAEKLKWRVGFRTDTLVHLATKPATITAKAPVEEDTDSEVIWNVEAKWFEKTKMKVVTSTALVSLFKCFELGEA